MMNKRNKPPAAMPANPPHTLQQRWTDKLAQRAHQHGLRTLKTRSTRCDRHTHCNTKPLLHFASNDYLGLAGKNLAPKNIHHAIQQWGLSGTSASLVSGYTQAHRDLEHILATWLQQDDAILFNSGFIANVSALQTLASAHDCCIHDRYNHASLLQGSQFSGASLLRYQHNNMTACEEKIIHAQQRSPAVTWLISESLFSMDGDITDLQQLTQLSRQYNCPLVIDEAHALGIFGTQGQGLTPHPGEATFISGTFGKAIASCGAFIAGKQYIIDALRQFAPGYVYSTALPAAIAEVTCYHIEHIQQAHQQRQHLQQLIAYFQKNITTVYPEYQQQPGPIQSLIIGECHRTTQLAQRLFKRGIWVQAIRPPTVPVGTARLRITLTAAHHFCDIDHLFEVFYDEQAISATN